jgi:hypothetical protein
MLGNAPKCFDDLFWTQISSRSPVVLKRPDRLTIFFKPHFICSLYQYIQQIVCNVYIDL